MVLKATVHLTANGLGSAYVVKLAVTALTTELAAIVRLQMV